jgi:hypothetical protein
MTPPAESHAWVVRFPITSPPRYRHIVLKGDRPLAHHHMLDPEKPSRFDHGIRQQVIAELRDRIRALEADGNGNVHRGDVLDTLTDD